MHRGNELRRLVSASSGTETCGLPARNRTWTTGFVDRCSDSTETGRCGVPRGIRTRAFRQRAGDPGPLDDGDVRRAPLPGIEPGVDRLEGDSPSVGRLGQGGPRGDQTVARGLADRVPLRESARRADSGSRTRIGSLEEFPVPFRWATEAVESARLEIASPGCRPGVLPLNYGPAGREGIEPSLRVLKARQATLALRPKNGDKCVKRLIAPNQGRPPVKPLGHSSCKGKSLQRKESNLHVTG